MHSRHKILVVFFGLLTLLWASYLFILQIVDPFHLSDERRIRYTPYKEILIPTRGSIYDANGNILVSSISFYQLDIDRKAVSLWAKEQNISLTEAYKMISETIGKNSSINPEQVYQRLTINDKLTSVQITNKIREMELEKILTEFEKNKLPGLIHTFSSMKRIYSQDLLAARLLGAVRAISDGYDMETQSRSIYQLSGICGLESTYNNVLAGEYGWREVVYDAKHRRMPYPNLHEKPEKDGYNLHLTIDANIQAVVEHALFEGLSKYGAINAGAVIMDPNTGRILAMAGVSPDDRNLDPAEVRVKANIPVSFLFEPGSTMKPLTMLAALDKHLVRPNEYFECGVYYVQGRKISDTHMYGSLRPVDIISKSSNVGIAKIAERVGPKNLYEKFISLG
ncbi:MAG: peptidoglycan glycosyltransferase, partial [Candidatus Cloacimonetes bacterium]|nr:peptidoglycan glycosyltransferase [Candidatus Cloacimonadota bacterium]